MRIVLTIIIIIITITIIYRGNLISVIIIHYLL